MPTKEKLGPINFPDTIPHEYIYEADSEGR